MKENTAQIARQFILLVAPSLITFFISVQYSCFLYSQQIFNFFSFNVSLKIASSQMHFTLRAKLRNRLNKLKFLF